MLLHVQAQQRGEEGLTLAGVILVTPLADGRVVAAFLRSGRVERIDAWLVRDALDLVCGLAGPLADCTELVVHSATAEDSSPDPCLPGPIGRGHGRADHRWRLWLSRAWSRRRAGLESGGVTGGGLG